MANTYIGYAERSAESQINWAEVGAQVSDMLNTEQKIRDDKRQEIDDATREYQKALADAPKGQSDRINGFTNDFVNKAQEQLLMTNRLLKSGQLDMKDYLNIRQNLTDQTGQMFDTLNKAQEYVKMHQDRLDSDEASAAEAMLMDQLTGFMNFKDTSSYVDAPTGILSIAKTKDGKMATDPNSFMTIGQMDEGFNTFVDKFKVDDALAGMEQQLGDVLNSELIEASASGRLSFVEKTKDKKTGKYAIQGDEDESIGNFLTMEDKYVRGLLTNKSHALSVLVDYVPGDYTISYNPEDQGKTIDGKEVVFINREKGFNEVELTKDQEERAVSFLKERFRSKIGVEKTKESVVEKRYRPEPRAKTAAELAQKASDEENANLLGLWNEIYYSDGPDKEERIFSLINSTRAIEGLGITHIGFTEEPILDANGKKTGKVDIILDVEYADEDMNISKKITSDGEPPTFEDWSTLGSVIHGITDRKKAMELGGGRAVPENYKERGTKWNPDFSQADVRRQAPDYVSGFVKEVLQEGGKTPITADLLEKDDGDVQKELQRILAGTNIIVDTKGWGENAIVLNRQGGSKAEEVVIDTGSMAYEGAFTVGGTDTGTEENLQRLLGAISSLLDEASAESQYKKRVGKPMTGALSRASAKASRQAGTTPTTPSASGTAAGNLIFQNP